jgi:hypothetical protein
MRFAYLLGNKAHHLGDRVFEVAVLGGRELVACRPGESEDRDAEQLVHDDGLGHVCCAEAVLLCVCVYVCMCVSVYVCTCVCVCVYMCMCVWVYGCIMGVFCGYEGCLSVFV